MYAGFYRTYLVLGNEASLLTSRIWCSWQPHNIIWVLSGTLQALMMLVVSGDRLFSVLCPMTHFGLTDIYAQKVMSGYAIA